MFAELIDGSPCCRDSTSWPSFTPPGPARSRARWPHLDPSARRRRDTPSSWERLQQTNILRDAFERTFDGSTAARADRRRTPSAWDDTGAPSMTPHDGSRHCCGSVPTAPQTGIRRAAADTTAAALPGLCGHVWHLPPSVAFDQSIAGGRLRIGANLSVGTEEGPSGARTGLLSESRDRPMDRYRPTGSHPSH